MDKIKIIILRREDLLYRNKIKKVDDISLYTSFSLHNLSYKNISKASFIVFMDDMTHYKIMKNRFSEDSPETKGILAYLGFV